MRLKRITLTNAFRHTKAAANFEDYGDAVCVVGPNGAGKSSIFCDGPLFALYGRPAVRGGSLENIVRRGADKAVVSLEFEIAGEVYQVNRSYRVRKSSGVSSVEVLKRRGDAFEPFITGHVADVDAEIVELVGADYTAFVMSAVMRQGQSSAFTSSTPAQRLIALTQLIGADRYRAAAKMIAKQIAETKEEIAAGDAAAAEYAAAADRIAELEKQHAAAVEASNAAATAHAADKDAEAAAVAAELEAARTLETVSFETKRADDVRAAIHQSNNTLQSLIFSRDAAAQGVCFYDDNYTGIEPTSEIRALVSHLEDAIDEWGQIHRDYESYDHAQNELARACGNMRVEIEALEYTQSRLFNGEEGEHGIRAMLCGITGGRAMLAVEGEPFDVSALEQRKTELEEQRAAKLELLSTVKAAAENSSALNDQAREFRESYQRAVTRLEERAHALEARPAECDMDHCGLLLWARAACVELDRQSDEDVNALEQRARAAAAAVEELPPLVQVDAELGALSRELEAIAEIREYVDAYQRAGYQLATMRERLKAASAAIDSASEEQGKLYEALKFLVGVTPFNLDLDALGAEVVGSSLKSQHRQASDRLILAHNRDLAAEQYEKNKQVLARTRADIDDIKARVASMVEEVNGITERLGANADAGERHAAAIAKVKEASAAAMSSSSALKEAQTEVARFEGAIATQRNNAAKVEAAAAAVETQRVILSELERAKAFCVAAPQILIGRAIPAITSAANALLADLAPGVIVEISRQRETKSGSVRDDLTILVHEDGRAADLATYSGGERFRIDLALRLALARIAAGRGAASIRTLIIDEGLGSQSADALEDVKATLVRLLARFDQIFVITHVDDAADMFGRAVTVHRAQPGHPTEVTQ